jgi:hypothetical protein
MADEMQDMQEAGGRITEAFDVHDKQALAKLTPDERAIQTKIRWELYRHVDLIWDAPHLRSKGVHPIEAGGYEGVAALRDLLNDLWIEAQQAQVDAGDDIDTVSVKMVVERDED